MTNTDISLRLARQADAATIAAMSRDLIEYGLDWRWRSPRVSASIHAKNVNVLVACAEEKIIGFAIMRYGANDAHLDLLAVKPEFQRTGIGGQLLQWLEKCALVAGTFNIELEVRTDNIAAQSFYERLGYRPLTKLPGYYQGKESALRMGRDLASRANFAGRTTTNR
ncbi:MAG: GNAT family N-acetyltransferase [Deltaproteobacteria bacterium]|nr:GNAT family N-acetyltransferase [Deltaproteobacteria bacterium]